MICEVKALDNDGVASVTVTHTIAESIKVKFYDDISVELSYDEALALARSIRVIFDSMEDDRRASSEEG